MRFCAAVFFTVGLLITASPARADNHCPPGEIYRIFVLVNQIRAANDLAPLEMNNQLMISARQRAFNLADREVLSHDGWRDSILKAGYMSLPIAENIAYGYQDGIQAVKGWYESRSHRLNILESAYRYMGVGCVKGRTGRLWWSQHFGGARDR